ncbi:hypothetical protein BV900_00485 [Agrobacterium tumefaciens]|nr:hypothetical protein BV900_00485 [Agrobacterium tumefaciens]
MAVTYSSRKAWKREFPGLFFSYPHKCTLACTALQAHAQVKSAHRGIGLRIRCNIRIRQGNRDFLPMDFGN